MQKMWWYVSGGARLGPRPAVELEGFLREGTASLETLVWRDGMPEWVAMEDVPEFAAVAKAHEREEEPSGPPPLPTAKAAPESPPPLPSRDVSPPPLPTAAAAVPQAQPSVLSPSQPSPAWKAPDALATGPGYPTPGPLAAAPARTYAPPVSGWGEAVPLPPYAAYAKLAEPTIAPAGAWRRFGARMFDTFVLGLTAYCVIAVVLDVFDGVDISHASAPTLKGFLITLALTQLIGFLVECATWALWQNTPGKWFFGLKVLDAQGNPLRTEAYVRRLVSVYIEGHGLGVPGVFIVTWLMQALRVSKGTAATYDNDKYLVLKVPSPSYGSRLAAGMGQLLLCGAAVALFTFWSVLQAPDETAAADTETSPASTPAPEATAALASNVWQNPVTGTRHAFPSGWVVTELSNQFGPYHRIQRGDEDVYLEVAHRKVRGAGLDEHGEGRLQGSVGQVWMRIYQSARVVEGRTIWTAQGEKLDDYTFEIDILLTPSEVASHLWEVSYYVDSRIPEAPKTLQELRTSLLDTLPAR